MSANSTAGTENYTHLLGGLLLILHSLLCSRLWSRNFLQQPNNHHHWSWCHVLGNIVAFWGGWILVVWHFSGCKIISKIKIPLAMRWVHWVCSELYWQKSLWNNPLTEAFQGWCSKTSWHDCETSSRVPCSKANKLLEICCRKPGPLSRSRSRRWEVEVRIDCESRGNMCLARQIWKLVGFDNRRVSVHSRGRWGGCHG